MSAPGNADKCFKKERRKKTPKCKNAGCPNAQKIDRFLSPIVISDTPGEVESVNSSNLNFKNEAGHKSCAVTKSKTQIPANNDLEKKLWPKKMHPEKLKVTEPLPKDDANHTDESELCEQSGVTETVESLKQSNSNAENANNLPLKVFAPKVTPSERVKTNQLKNGSISKSMAAEENKITAYFPVRKSNRKTETKIKEEKYMELKSAMLASKEDGLEIQEVAGKGRGVIAKRDFERGEFIAEYRGELISRVEALKREEKYRDDCSIGCYMYYFMHRNKHYCIDATQETEYKARLINHSAKGPNCVAKIVEVCDEPHIALFSSRRVRVGEELLYNYGDRSKASVAAHPWLINS